MSIQATKRLNKEYKQIQQAPPPYIIAKPNEKNILDWHYVITGPPGTPYEGGQYHGRVTFPTEYPFKPPRIKMCTPSGRFEVNKRLCLSMSDFHEESWNPSWSVATILTGLLSFMTGDERTTGSIVTSDTTKRKLASESKTFNCDSNPMFKEVFPDLYVQNVKDLNNPSKTESAVCSGREHEETTPKDNENRNDNGHKTIVEQELDAEDKIRIQLAEQKAKELERNGTNGGSSSGVPGLAFWVCVIVGVIALLMKFQIF